MPGGRPGDSVVVECWWPAKPRSCVTPSHREEQGTAQDALGWSNITPLLSPSPTGNRVCRQLPQTYQPERLGPADLGVWEDDRGHHKCMHYESLTFTAIPWKQHTPCSALTLDPTSLPLSRLPVLHGLPPNPHRDLAVQVAYISNSSFLEGRKK